MVRDIDGGCRCWKQNGGLLAELLQLGLGNDVIEAGFGVPPRVKESACASHPPFERAENMIVATIW
jgi:hypothetical protein